MTNISLSSLGLTEETLADRVVDKIAGSLLESLQYDEDGGEWHGDSKFAQRLSSQVANRLNKIVDDLAEKHVIPRATEMIETLVLQETNKWGEKIGKPVTFIEYLTQRAENWVREEVSFDGKTKGQDSYGWKKAGTRIEYMIDKHLQYSIDRAMREAVGAAHQSIIGGLKDAVNIKLGEIAIQLKTEVVKK
ncbi:MAG TPA: hypothetical protein DCL54_03325 [Alphaproteobacteria bacterium]|nr:hypothetical protein [Alphaproteobacteria bacterium]